MSERTSPSRRATLARGAGLVAVGMTAMNAAAYVFTLLAARVLGPDGYSEVAALMGMVLVANVVAMGVQATTARHVAARGRSVDPDPLLRAGRRVALLLAGVVLALSPVATVLLRLGSWAAPATVAVTAAALTVTGSQLGLFQGSRRWGDFAMLSVAFGVGRLALGGAAIWVAPTPLSAMTGVALGALVPAAAGHVLVRRRPPGRRSVQVPMRHLGHEVLHDSHTLLAFFVLTQADVFVARAVLPTPESGQYAAGLILTKAVLFLPTFVAVMAYPVLARRGGRRHVHHLGLLLVLGIGLVVVAGALLAPAAAVAFVGGPAYAAVEPDLWLFAVLGTVAAMIQLLVQTALARSHRSAAWWVWAAVAAVVAGAPFVDSGHALLLFVLAVDTVLLVALVVVTWSEGSAGPRTSPERTMAPDMGPP